MVYDERLAARIRQQLPPDADVEERKMFGGLCFLAGGKMLVGIVGDDLMVRIGPDALAAALAQRHVRVMDFTGRPSRNMVYVAPAGVRTAPMLATWIARARAFVDPLPRAKPRPPRPRVRVSRSPASPRARRS